MRPPTWAHCDPEVSKPQVRAVLDTNVGLSRLFFGGVPGRALEAWRDGPLTLVLSAPILAEYREAGADFRRHSVGSTPAASASFFTYSLYASIRHSTAVEPFGREHTLGQLIRVVLIARPNVHVHDRTR
jgi:hypothetical protein